MSNKKLIPSNVYRKTYDDSQDQRIKNMLFPRIESWFTKEEKLNILHLESILRFKYKKKYYLQKHYQRIIVNINNADNLLIVTQSFVKQIYVASKVAKATSLDTLDRCQISEKKRLKELINLGKL